MNFETYFECCNGCSPTNVEFHNNKLGLQGQGDYEYNPEAGGDRSFWMSLGQENGSVNKFVSEINKSESKKEEEKKLGTPCYCLAKQNLLQELKEKKSREKKQKRIFENFQDKCFWDFPSLELSSKSDRQTHSDRPKSNECLPLHKSSTENNIDFREKVDFLFQIFKDHGQEISVGSRGGQPKTKETETLFRDLICLYDFNQRLCTAEESIEKLVSIMEDLIEEAASKKNENSARGDQLNFEDMSITQRIDFLKSRNDLILGFIKNFFKVGSLDESGCRIGTKPSEFNKSALIPKMDFGERLLNQNFKKEGVVETLKRLRIQMTELRQKKTQLCNEQQKKAQICSDHRKLNSRQKEENAGTKYGRNKLEVISEQAELVFCEDNGKSVGSFREKCEARTSKVEDKEPDERPLSVTSRILAEEAEFLKTSLDNVRFSELFKKLELPENSFGPKTEIPSIEENKKDDVELNLNSLSSIEINCSEKSLKTERPSLIGKYVKQKELKKPLKQENNCPEEETKDAFKQESASKCTEESPKSKLQLLHSQRRKCYSIFSNKGTPNSVPGVPPEEGSSKSGKKIKEAMMRESNQRPATEPTTRRKILPPSSFKPSTEDKSPGINNVKNKNKILLSKKSCVQMS